jgi:xylulose-5-phosphate/fructose-6-phosphate phosphoketolase
MLAVMKECAASKNQINIIVSGKTPEPQWVTYHEAEKQIKTGLATWDFVSEENPDIVFAGIGDYLTKETIATIKLLKNVAPEIKSRFVNILELSTFGFGNTERKMTRDEFSKYFTEDKPVIFNFHGYPEVIQAMLFQRGDTSRFSVHGYIENGSTTTPFDMHIRNKTSRYHLATEALTKMVNAGVIEAKKAESIISDINKNMEEHHEYILKNGVDPEFLQ